MSALDREGKTVWNSLLGFSGACSEPVDLLKMLRGLTTAQTPSSAPAMAPNPAVHSASVVLMACDAFWQADVPLSIFKRRRWVDR